MKKYLLSEADRNAIADLMSKAQSAPPRPLIADTRQKPNWQEGDSYWVLPPCETGLPAAEIVGGKLVTVGVECCLYRHVWALDELEPIHDTLGNPIRITVFNYYTRQENGLVQVYKHKDGTWTNERPEKPTFLSTTEVPFVTGVGSGRQDIRCQGQCRFEANADGIWQAPTGGCANATTTTTTTGTPQHPGTTVRPAPIATTPSPCVDRECILVCVDSSTTPAPIAGVPVPWETRRYALADGSSCPAGCTCYGLGEPCYIVTGELVSYCTGNGPTAAPTTTINPASSACVFADAALGTVLPFYYRTATKNNAGLVDWEVCQTCAPGSQPLFPLRGAPYRVHDQNASVTVYESPCVQSPCGEIPSILDDGATFVAYPYEVQVRKWGYDTGATFIDETPNNVKFLANWFVCKSCEGDKRPVNAPPVWIYNDASKNAQNGVYFDVASNTYRFRALCEDGFSCNTCGRAPLRREFPYQGPVTSAPSTTTTTFAPCGCIRPNFCPVPFECVRTPCVSGGEVVNGVFGTTQVPSVPCFPDSTTTPGPTTTTTTTPGPNQCVDTYGTLCNCATTTTTADPSGGTCPPGYIFGYDVQTCTYRCYFRGNPPVVTTGLPLCGGYCRWVAVRLLNDDGTPSDTLSWQHFWGMCPAVDAGFTDTRFGRCTCANPIDLGAPAPTVCGGFTSTPCEVVTPPTSTGGPTTTLPPCACCSTTTPNPCDVRKCRYRANSARQWVLVANNCPSNCPCPNPGGLDRPATTCESFELPCGFVLPPPTTVPPSTTTNTSTTTTTTIGPNTLGCCTRFFPGGTSFCVTATQLNCLSLGGVFSGPPFECVPSGINSICQPTTTTTTPSPTGCCLQFTNGNPSLRFCSVQTAAQCSAIGGFFNPGSSCVSINALETACVISTATPAPSPTTTTTTTTFNPCTGPCPYSECGCSGGGSVGCPAGSAVDCATCICGTTTTTTTSAPLGRCCVGATCSVITEAACTLAGGTWTLGGDCSDMNPCGPPPP